jgi:hypothetical protein
MRHKAFVCLVFKLVFPLAGLDALANGEQAPYQYERVRFRFPILKTNGTDQDRKSKNDANPVFKSTFPAKSFSCTS